MSSRQFALALGVVFIGVGILGFIPGINQAHDDPNLSIHGPGQGMLLGLFHVNLMHNLVHILFGILGVASAYGGWPRNYCRFVAVVYAFLALLGGCPDARINTIGGICPVGGNDIWLHALIAVAAAIFGWGVRDAAAPVATADTTRAV